MYAEGTSVPVDRSQSEIRKTLEKYKAIGFMFAEESNRATVAFLMNGKKLKFTFSLPMVGDKKPGKNYVKYSKEQAAQETRRLWRCLLLSIKSKLECVESGISSFEEEFLSHIVLPDGKTYGEFSIPQIENVYKNREMPLMLSGPKSD